MKKCLWILRKKDGEYGLYQYCKSLPIFYEVTSIFLVNWKTRVILRTHLFRDL